MCIYSHSLSAIAPGNFYYPCAVSPTLILTCPFSIAFGFFFTLFFIVSSLYISRLLERFRLGKLCITLKFLVSSNETIVGFITFPTPKMFHKIMN